jgi:hypothetical protein
MEAARIAEKLEGLAEGAPTSSLDTDLQPGDDAEGLDEGGEGRITEWPSSPRSYPSKSTGERAVADDIADDVTRRNAGR